MRKLITVICKNCGNKRLVQKYDFIKSKTKKCFNCSRNIKGANAFNYKRGWFIRSGYKFILQPDHPFANNLGYVREHRLIMEKIIGRYLKPEEIIHHRDKNKLNNDSENLEIISKSLHPGKHPQRKKICVICSKPQVARGYCSPHYWIFFLKRHRAKKFHI